MKQLADDLNKQKPHATLPDRGAARPLTDSASDTSRTVQCTSDSSPKHRPWKPQRDDLKLSYFWQMSWHEARHFDLTLLQARSWL